ncbi:MAG: NUDIX domain-containing protein [Myxococcales bacterium]|nr:NUDIX domain-containing protein [Myxococcales bacterium]MDD9965888.1 NUDIX domain-containing protein [Myxococcales bacterium]
MGEADERVDLVDQDDQAVGTVTRQHMRAGNLWHRTVAILCQNGRGQIYVQRRSDRKDLFPGQYDMFASGCVSAGEDYEAAAQRELAEELGITDAVLQPLFKHRYDGSETRTHTWIYRVRWDGPITHEDGEVAWGGFVQLADLLQNRHRWTFVADGAAHFAALVRQGLVG